MFVPDWSSLGQESNNATEGNNETTTTDFTGNGDDPHNNTANPTSEAADTEVSSIELTHDYTTGVTTVTSDEEEDGMNQCAMWTSTSPKEEEDYSYNNNAAATSDTYSDPNHVLSSFGGGDIWTTEGFSFESPLKDLLDSNVYSLVDLLEQDELLQELRGCEDRLISYFSKPEVVAGLVECIICEVPYVNEEGGKERWCREEKERRERMAEEKHGGTGINNMSQLNESIDNDNDTGLNSCDPTILDTTNEIEATWTTPSKNPQLISSKHEATTENQISLEEEYDLRYFRYPYMACEVLCSDVGDTLDVLINGCVQDITIDDDDDSLLNGSDGVTLQQSKSQEKEELYDNIDVSLDALDEKSSTELNDHSSHQPNPPPTPRNQPVQNTRILDLLFSVVIDTPPFSLDDRRAGYFEKLLVILFRKYSQTMSDFMNTPLIETEMSKAKIHIISSTNNDADDSAYVSLMPSMDSVGTEDESQLISSNLRPLLSPIKTQLPVSDGPHVDTPPMLMCALFDNLHSHSIMHIVQRLLLPSAARQQQKSKDVDSKSDQDTGSCSPNSDMNDRFMSAISEMNNAADQNHNDDEEGMADDDIDNPIDHLFQCDWSEHPLHALELLLSRLDGQVDEPYLMKYNFPTGYDESLLQAENGADSNDTKTYDAKMSCAHHASEILVGIIQNSPLDSAAIMALSSEPFLSQIIQMSSFSSGSKKMQTIVPYESTMTCAMTVLEHLILQLGGYGSVTALAASGNSMEKGIVSPSPVKETDVSFSLTELGPHTPVSSPAPPDAIPTIATTATLLRHLPNLLEDFSSLLVHPDAKIWSTPVQYMHSQSQPILGTIRIRIIRLIESLVLLGDPVADLLLQQSDCIECCLNLFWEFEWCSMLHQSVTNFVVHVLEAGDDRAGLQDYLIVRCQLLEKVLNSFTSDAYPTNEFNQNRKIEAIGVNDDALAVAMKTIYTNPVTSSLESLDGSESDNSCKERLVDGDENEAVALVSDDDIESAMEKEEQDNQAMNTSLNSCTAPEDPTIPQTPANDDKLAYRRGYMGHVIIISQALVKACNLTSQYSVTPNNQTEKSQDNGPPQVDDFLQNAIMTAEFEHCAVHLLSEDSPPCSKKRLDTSPTRIGDNNLPMSPISKDQCSPNDVESIARSPLDCKNGEDSQDVSHLQRTISQHPLAERWIYFVSTTLAYEIALQSSPLGGQPMNKNSAASVGSDSKSQFASVINDEPNSDFLGHKGVFGIIDGDFDMNEAEIDIAAEMMESLTLNSNNIKDSQINGKNGIASGTLTGNEGSNGHIRNIGNFGSLIQSNSCSTESKGYVYDDPLGSICQFEHGDSSDEEDMDFAPKAANFDKEASKKSLSKSNSTDEEDSAPPVLDLFTGNFAENFTNDHSQPSTEQESSTDITWANFANFEDIAFEEEAATPSATAKIV